MRIQGVELPDVLTQAIEEDNLVIFAGAGVSMQPPDPLPDFTELVKGLVQRAGTTPIPTRDGNERYESYLGRLGDPLVVKHACADIMSQGGYSRLHANLLSLFAGGPIRVVTTNYDLRFEQAAQALGIAVRTFSSPALPLGNSFEGIVHLHGDTAHPNEMIVVDADYGSAYVSDGWVARFLVKMFQRYVVLFVGYSLGDVPVQYLARSISSELQDRVFVLEIDPSTFARWRRRGITPIPIQSFAQLPELFRQWKPRVLRTTQQRVEAVKHIAATREPLSDYAVETLRKALNAQDPVDQRAYAQAYVDYAWDFDALSRLVDLGYGSCLFERPSCPRDEVLAHWAALAFAIRNRRELVRIAETMHRPFAGSFQVLVMEQLATGTADDACLAFWSAFLSPRAMGSAGLTAQTVARVIARCRHHQVALAYIRMAFSVHAALVDGADGSAAEPVVHFDVDVTQGSEELQAAIAQHAPSLAPQLFLLCVDRLEHMEGLATSQWIHEPTQATDKRQEAAKALLSQLCLALGTQLVTDAATRDAALEACAASRAEVVRAIGQQLNCKR